MKNRKRAAYLIPFVALTAAEVFIALLIHDDFIRPYAGDILVVMVLYCLVRLFLPDRIRLLPLYLFIFSAAVEISQYFHFFEYALRFFGLANDRFFRILLGSTFDWRDIACYGIGCMLLEAFERWKRRGRRKAELILNFN